jgi:glycopeptide antibiotics resistance protein
MTHGATPAGRGIGRGTYALAAIAYLGFAVYVSLVPLEFHPGNLEQAWTDFRASIVLPMYVQSRTDFTTNVLLFVPLGYLAAAAVGTGWKWLSARAAAAFMVVPACIAASVGIEFAQAFFQGRTSALSDIVGESTGGLLGAIAWLIAGPTVNAWIHEFLLERERTAVLRRILLAYVLLLVGIQLLPADLTISVEELRQKFRDGRVVWRPFTRITPFSFEAAWDYIWDVMLNVPVGAAVTLVGRPAGKRTPREALGIGLAILVAVEVAQLFVSSRYTDVTDLITGMIGIGLGIALVNALEENPDAAGSSATLVVSRLGLLAWIAIMLGYHWSPYDFSVDAVRFADGLQQMLTIPFSYYYMSTQFTAATQIVRKLFLALPIGVLARMAWPDRGRPHIARVRTAVTLVFGFALLVVIEIGQGFLPSRLPDITDAIVGVAGIALGLWLSARASQTLRVRP